MSNNIEGKVIVITGASSGLGEAAARHLAASGAIVVLGARRTERIQALANELTASGRSASYQSTDVTNREQVARLVEHAVERFGRIDVMLNNAGLMPNSPFDRLKVEDWDRMIDVNLKGVLYGIAAALPRMQRQKSGHFINVSSELTQSITEPDVLANMEKTYESAIPADSFARAVAYAISQPDEVDINEILFRPTSQAF